MILLIKKKSLKYNLIQIILLDLILSFYLQAYNLVFKDKIFESEGITKDKILELISSCISYKFLIVFIVLGCILVVFYKFKIYICKYVYRYRYIIALAIFILCICFEISGSSIGMWNDFLPQSGDSVSDGVLFGNSRIIRTDEWAVNTPMAFAQYHSDFSYFSDVIRGSATDMFIVYGQAVKDIVMIFRPFYLGYLFLSPAKGLAFFWCGRIICLFMVTFECAMIITKRNKKYSFITACLITFAPVVQWWFAVNGLVEMLIFSQLSIIMLHKYMNTINYKKRFLYAFIIMICAGGYILTFYPAWQVPIAYVLLGLIIWTIKTNWKNFKFSIKKDIPIIVVILCIFAYCTIHIIDNSLDTIKTVLNTTYPGKRVSTGGMGFGYLWKYVSNIFMVVNGNGVPNNQCEDSVFFDLFPLGIIFALYIIIKQRKKDFFLIIMLIINLMLISFVVFPWPKLIAKLTLLSYSTTIRTNIAIGLINIFLFIRSISIWDKEDGKVINKAIISSILACIVVYFSQRAMGEYMNNTIKLISVVILFILFFLAFTLDKFRNIFTIILCSLVIFMGGMVNPIRTGTDVIYNNRLAKAIEEIVRTDDGIWVVEDMSIPFINYPMMLGARTINCTNTYPNLDMWKKLDSEERYNKIYNRYAHIQIKFTDEKTNFVLNYPDNFQVNLNVNDLEKLNISYILSANELDSYSNENVNIKLINNVDNFKFYEVSYK